MTEADIDLGYALKLAPAEAVKYFRGKNIAVTDDWRELWQAAHTRAFTVAKMTQHDLLAKTREVVLRKLADGLSERQVAAVLEEEFRKAGWWGKRASDGARLGSARRIKTILRTNTMTAYAAGRHQRQVENASNRPWWRYVAIQDGVTRLAHRQLHGKILRHDDPAWEAIYPPNGFNCRCRVTALTEKEAQAAGADAQMKGDAPETRDVDMVSRGTGEVFRRPVTQVRLTDRNGERWFAPDAGWGYRPGAFFAPGSPSTDWKALGFVSFKERLKRQKYLPKPPPAPRQAATKSEALNMLHGAVGISIEQPSRRYDTPIGPVIIDADSVAHIVDKFDDHRERFANRILPTLDAPDEVWRVKNKNGEFRTRYIKLWDDKKGTVAIVDLTGDGRVLFNFMPYRNAIDNQRKGQLLYKRSEKMSGE